MTSFLFPDNTVLCNFAAARSLELLKSVLDERGRWTEAVAYEATQSARVLPELAVLEESGWLGKPIEVNDEKEIQAIDRIRRAVFGGSDVKPLQHLGEAQTCYLLQHRPEFADSWWISDDREAIRYARYQGITTRETVDLVAEAVVGGLLTAKQGISLCRRMAEAGRALRLPVSEADLYR
ncbi:hypothetical protein [Cryptosporangium sp. NPDC051539]|uniref:hypothetical protein n=1 Tax=Cryptosporangium sp. NPDC051539 TaxID=3363962 RepID=UPI00379CE912